MLSRICFVIQKFDDGGFFDELYDDVIEIAVKNSQAKCLRSDKILGAKPPLEKIEASIRNAGVCIAEVTLDNPNVFFEAGWAFALGKPIFVLWDKSKRPQGLPFDIHNKAGIPYDSSKPGWRKELRDTLVENIAFELAQSSQEQSEESNISVADLLNAYLPYCKKHLSPRTYNFYARHFSSFLEFIGNKASSPASTLRPFQITEWLDSKVDWSDTYVRGGIAAILAAYNWAVKSHRIASNPIKGIEKPKAVRRNNPMPLSDYEKMRSFLKKGSVFHDVLTFSWNTDCRPEELRNLEAKHIDLHKNRIRISGGIGRAKQKERSVQISGEAIEIANRLVKQRPKGILFLNERKEPWTKDAICNRFQRYSDKIGKQYALSDCRNGVERT